MASTGWDCSRGSLPSRDREGAIAAEIFIIFGGAAGPRSLPYGRGSASGRIKIIVVVAVADSGHPYDRRRNDR